MYCIEDYDFDLREDLIAQIPAAGRDQSRLLHVDRRQEKLSDCNFFDLPGLLQAGDLIVINNTKVVPARLYGMKESGGRAEILVLEHPESLDDSIADSRWCLVKSSKRPKIGSRILFERDVSGTVEELAESGLTKILFTGPISVDRLLEDEGWVPLPPYIKRESKDMAPVDRERYQTIFSRKRGAVAAPTAGLHFTGETVAELEKADITIAGITLHVGYGTFQPVRVSDIREHVLGDEYYSISPETAEAINRAKREKRRVIAVGTTTVRTLESVTSSSGHIEPGSGKTGLLITPGFQFRAVDGLITNFHLPRSSLLFLVSAFGGRDLIKRAYEHAIKAEYRFYSYGDAMLII
ncbi:MAG: tRNA preQ1(34) S-adenosylmethionine ribosyltransferase-isomerase QueA [Desulfobacteraceae bacterium]|jgi:S-adenosylmethionine:tRNA ribosyltransferase-isomerase